MSAMIVKFGELAPLNELEGPDSPSANSMHLKRLEEFGPLWDSCRVPVRAYLSSLLANRSDLEDCIQEVALIAWKKGPAAEGQRAFLGHCLAAARLVGLAASRKVGNARVRFLPPDVALALADQVTHQEQEQGAASSRILALRACMSLLNEEQRTWLACRYSDEGRQKLEEVARRQGKSPDAVYKMLERLRGSLRACISKRIEGETDAN